MKARNVSLKRSNAPADILTGDDFIAEMPAGGEMQGYDCWICS